MSDILAFRSTTPTVVLKVNDENFDMTQISICHVTIENDSGRNKKIFSDCQLDNEYKTISFTMSQEDTLSYESGTLLLQVKIKLVNDSVLASPIIRTTMEKILEEDIL